MIIDFVKKVNKKNILYYFPELHVLEMVIEKNICHDNESVFNHTINVFYNSKNILNKLNQKQLNYFNKTIDDNKVKDLFLVAVLFHDIGKFKTLKVRNNFTFCNNHEIVGTKLFEKSRFKKMTSNELRYIQKIIKNHTLIQLCFDDRNNFNEKYSNLKKEYSDIFLELVIIGISDIYRSDLEKNNKIEYEYRIKKLSNIIKIKLK